MNFKLSTLLPCALVDAVHYVKQPRLLTYVAWPLVRFVPENRGLFERPWEAGTHWVRLYLFGVLPFGRQAIVISYPEDKAGFALCDAGHSRLIASWHHLIVIEQAGEQVRYTDHLSIRAGVLTPFIVGFAQVFYRHRQRRWRKLVRLNFKPLD
jgi:hypothetical protein